MPAERIVGVSETAYEPRLSNVSEYVARYHPIVANDPERVLLANPDLVITAESVRAEVPDLLRQAGLPVYRMYTMFETLASIEEHIRLVGYLTGEDERAEAEIVRFRGVITQAAARRPATWRPHASSDSASAVATATAHARCSTTSFACSAPRTFGDPRPRRLRPRQR